MKRIKALAKYINPYKIIADIGCDHGYLIKEAIDNYNIDIAYAVDNKQGPIERAKDTLKYYDNVIYSLSSGLSSLNDDVECVVIAGMGGGLICDILENDKIKLNNIKRIIIQANKDEYKVRKYLTDNGFNIIFEEVLEEDNKYYEIDVFEHGSSNYNDKELLFGPILIRNKSKEFIEKWQIKYNKYKEIDDYHLNPQKIELMKGIEKILCK